MSLQVGYIDENGHPKIKIRVEGTNPGVVADLEALIDTGFTGFLALPLVQALPLGLVLIGTADYSLADGSTMTNFLPRGSVTVGPSAGTHPSVPNVNDVIDDERAEGAIVLAGEEPLIGMEFLRGLNKSLLVGSVVKLVDEADLASLL